MKKTTMFMMAACGAMTANTQAEPVVYLDANRSIDMGIFNEFTLGFRPLDITQPAASQLDTQYTGSLPENGIVMYFQVEGTSTDISSWSLFTHDSSGIGLVSGEVITIHHHAMPGWAEDMITPLEFEFPNSVGLGVDSRQQLHLSVGFTVEYGLSDYWFVERQFTIGVVLEMDDGTHYGFVEFEDVRSLTAPQPTGFRPVRWGYETTPDVPFVIPSDCGDADSNRDGVLNFFDISLFLTAYSESRLAVDLNHDNQVNFFDVSAFLSAFSAGCP